MQEKDIQWVISDIRLEQSRGTTVPDPGQDVAFPLLSRIVPRSGSAGTRELEEILGLTLPDDLRKLWATVDGLRLFEDVKYGQWGLIIWSPSQVLVNHPGLISGREHQFRDGDLLIGDFLGDADLLMARCDANKSDFGSIIVARPIDPPEEWPVVATSLTAFLAALLHTRGKKFWEHTPGPS